QVTPDERRAGVRRQRLRATHGVGRGLVRSRGKTGETIDHQTVLARGARSEDETGRERRACLGLTAKGLSQGGAGGGAVGIDDRRPVDGTTVGTALSASASATTGTAAG